MYTLYVTHIVRKLENLNEQEATHSNKSTASFAKQETKKNEL